MEAGQEYVLNTFNLGGRMKVLPLIWKEEYKKHVVTPGPFHTGMNYMGMVTNAGAQATLKSSLKLGSSQVAAWSMC